MEVTARGAPGGRPGEPKLAPEHVEAGVDGIAQGRHDQRLGYAVSFGTPAPAGLGRAERFPEPMQAVADLQNRVPCGFWKDRVTGLALRILAKRRRDARVTSAAAGPARARRALAACSGDSQGGRRLWDSPYLFSVINPVRGLGWRTAVGRSCTVVSHPAGDRLTTATHFPGLRLLSCGHRPAHPASRRTPPRWQARHQTAVAADPSAQASAERLAPGQHVQPRERRSAPRD